MVIKGRVEGGRLKVDEEIDLPDGTEVEMFIIDEHAGVLDAPPRLAGLPSISPGIATLA